MAEEVLPGRGLGWLRRPLAPLMAWRWDWMTGPEEYEYFEHVHLIQADATMRFDTRDALPRIRVRCCSSTATGTATSPRIWSSRLHIGGRHRPLHDHLPARPDHRPVPVAAAPRLFRYLGHHRQNTAGAGADDERVPAPGQGLID